MFQSFYLWKNNLIDRRVGGPLSQCGSGGNKKNDPSSRNWILVIQPVISHSTDWVILSGSPITGALRFHKMWLIFLLTSLLELFLFTWWGERNPYLKGSTHTARFILLKLTMSLWLTKGPNADFKGQVFPTFIYRLFWRMGHWIELILNLIPLLQETLSSDDLCECMCCYSQKWQII